MLHPFRRQILPDERDAEYAAAILDDGSIDPVWSEANTHRNGFITSLPMFPYVPTPDLLADLLEPIEEAGRYVSEDMREAIKRRLPYVRLRYPLTYARMVETAPARRERQTRERKEREEEDAVAQTAALAARLQFRAERELQQN
jgi:hypothetical protein